MKPWREDSFTVSPDPDLVEKSRDLGLSMSPPVNAAVFAVHEKPQIQALDRTPVLPTLSPTSARASIGWAAQWNENPTLSSGRRSAGQILQCLAC